MSIQVTTAVFRHSKATLGSRLVLLTLADAAHNDGVTWLAQEDVAERTLLTTRQVSNCVKTLVGLGELEMRKAQRGRRRINVYRIVLPGVDNVVYDRLPFTLKEEFTTGKDFVSSPDDDRKSTTATTGKIVQPTRAREGEPSVEPSGTSSGKPSSVAPRKRNLPFDALVEVCPGTDPDVDGGRVAKALADIVKRLTGEVDTHPWELMEGAGGDAWKFQAIEGGKVGDNEALAREIRRRAQLYEERWPEIELTPTALAHNWTRVILPDRRRGIGAREMLSGVDPEKL